MHHVLVHLVEVLQAVLHLFVRVLKIRKRNTLNDGLINRHFCFMYSFMNKKYYTYILLTEKGTYYCGYTDNVEKRFEMHKEGKGAKYTRANKPIKIVYSKEFPTKSEAMKEEIRIKSLSHAQKTELINS